MATNISRGFGSVGNICNHSFLPRPLNADSVVLDFGGNYGEFAQGMISQIGCRVISAEPVSELVAKMPKNDRHTVIHVAVGGANKLVDINVFTNRCASLFGALSEGEKANQESVEMVTLKEFRRRAGVSRVDLLKLDIEGSEIEMFAACADDELRSIGQITIEFHEFLYPEQGPEVRKIRERLKSLGFWVMPFSLDNTDVLFVNKSLGFSPLEIFYAQTVVKYSKGIRRRTARSLQRATPANTR